MRGEVIDRKKLNLISKNNSYNLVKHHLEYINRLGSIILDENIGSETSIQKNWWNFTSSIFNKKYKTRFNQNDVLASVWNRKNLNQSMDFRETFNFYDKAFVEQLPLEYKKEEKEETDVIQVLQENPSILRELFYKEVLKDNLYFKSYFENQWNLESSILAEKSYEKYIKEQKSSVLYKGQEIFSLFSSIIKFVKNVWNNTSEITNYVKNKVEKSVISKEIVPLFSSQEWIKDLISSENIPLVLEQKEKKVDAHWNIKTLERLVPKWNKNTIETLVELLSENVPVFYEKHLMEVVPLEYKKEIEEETDIIKILQENPSILRKLFYKEVLNNNLYFEHYLKNQWNLENFTLAEKIYKKYTKEQKDSVLQKGQELSSISSTIKLVNNLWNTTSEIINYVKNKVEKSVLSKEIVPLFSKQEWIKNLIFKEINLLVFEQKEINAKVDWNIQAVENLISQRNKKLISQREENSSDLEIEVLENLESQEQNNFDLEIKVLKNLLLQEENNFHWKIETLENLILQKNEDNNRFSWNIKTLEKLVPQWNKNTIATLVSNINTTSIYNSSLRLQQWLEKNSSSFKEENFVEQLTENVPVFYEEQWMEVLPLEYRKEVEETDVIEVLRENPGILRELFYKEVLKSNISFENYLEKQWNLENVTLAEKLYKKYAREREGFVIQKGQAVFNPSSTITLVQNLWNTTSEITNYVKNKVEKSVLSKEIVPLFSKQEWIRNLITRETNSFVLEQKAIYPKSDWNIEEIENVPVFYEEQWMEVLPLEYRKEIEETDVIEVLRENPSILQELFYKEVLNDNGYFENYLKNQWNLENVTLAQKVYKKYAKGQEGSFLQEGQGLSSVSSTIKLVKNLWNTISEITNYVKNKVEKSMLSKEIVPLFSSQEWIRNLITRETIPFVLEQKEIYPKSDWNIEEIENVIVERNETNGSVLWNIEILEKLVPKKNKKILETFVSSINNTNIQQINNRSLFLQQWLEKNSSSFKEENFTEQLSENVSGFSEEQWMEVLPLEYRKEVEETDVIEVLRENPSILRELFYKKVLNDNIYFENYLKNQWNLENVTLAEKLYKKYAKGQEGSFLQEEQGLSSVSSTIKLVKNLWNTTSEITNYVKNKVEKSMLSKEIVPLFSSQEWIRNLITRETIPFVLEQKAIYPKSDWNIEEIENVIVERNETNGSVLWNIETLEKIVPKKNKKILETFVSSINNTNIQQIHNRSLFLQQWLEKKSSSFKEENFVEQLIENVPVFYEEQWMKVLPLEYKKEVEETDVIEVLRENPSILRELFYKEILKSNVSFENYLEKQWNLENSTLAEKIYKKYTKEREGSILHKGQDFSSVSSTINLVKNLRNNTSEITNYVKNKIEKSILSRELVPLFSEQEWIKNFIFSETIPLMFEQKEKSFVEQFFESVSDFSEKQWLEVVPLEYKKEIVETDIKEQSSSPWNIESLEKIISQKTENNVTSFLKQNAWSEHTIKTGLKIISNISNYPKVVAELIFNSNSNLSKDSSIESKTEQLLFRKNVELEESKASSSSDLLQPLEQTIVYKIEKKSEETKEVLNKEMKNFIYSQVEQIVQSKLEDYEVRRNQTENQKIDEALEKIVEEKTNKQKQTSQISVEDFDIDDIYEKVYRKIERTLRSEMRKTGR